MTELTGIEEGLSSADEETRWQAAIAAGDLIGKLPDDVWALVMKYGVSDDPDLRGAIATCVLEHLLQYWFERYFPILRQEIENGNRNLADTFCTCWKFGQSETPENSRRWDDLVTYVRKRNMILKIGDPTF